MELEEIQDQSKELFLGKISTRAQSGIAAPFGLHA